MRKVECPTTSFSASVALPHLGNDFPVIFSTHCTGPLIANNRVRPGGSGSFSAGPVQAYGFPGNHPGALFFQTFYFLDKNVEYNSSSLAAFTRLEKYSDVAIFWCLISTVTIFILAMLKSMPIFG